MSTTSFALSTEQEEALFAHVERQEVRSFEELRSLIVEVVKLLSERGEFVALYRFLSRFKEVGDDGCVTNKASPMYPVTDLWINEDMVTGVYDSVSFDLLGVDDTSSGGGGATAE